MADDTALDRDVAHLVEMVAEIKDDIKDIGRVQEENGKELVALATWRNGHGEKHKGDSRRLGKLETQVDEIKTEMGSIKREMSKWGAIGAVFGGGGIAAVIELVKSVIL